MRLLLDDLGELTTNLAEFKREDVGNLPNFIAFRWLLWKLNRYITLVKQAIEADWYRRFEYSQPV